MDIDHPAAHQHDDDHMVLSDSGQNGSLKRPRQDDTSPESPISLSNEPAEDRKKTKTEEKKSKKVDVVVVPGPHSVAAAKDVKPNEFDPENHYYPRVINAQIHPMVSWFMSLGNERIAIRYCHVHPRVNAQVLRQMLAYKPRFFRWAG